MRPGCSSMSLNRGSSASVSARPMAKATPTSSGVCTPRYIREKATSSTAAMPTARSQPRRVQAARLPKEAKAFCVCPLGKE